MITQCDITALSSLIGDSDTARSENGEEKVSDSSMSTLRQEINEEPSEKDLNNEKEHEEENMSEENEELPDLEPPSQDDDSYHETSTATDRHVKVADSSVNEERSDEVPVTIKKETEEEQPPEMEGSIKQEPEEEEDEVYCAVCHDGGDLLYCCDRCPKIYHLACYIPPMKEAPPDDWVQYYHFIISRNQTILLLLFCFEL